MTRGFSPPFLTPFHGVPRVPAFGSSPSPSADSRPLPFPIPPAVMSPCRFPSRWPSAPHHPAIGGVVGGVPQGLPPSPGGGVPRGLCPLSVGVSARSDGYNTQVGGLRSCDAAGSRRVPKGLGTREIGSDAERGRAPSIPVRCSSGPVPPGDPASPPDGRAAGGSGRRAPGCAGRRPVAWVDPLPDPSPMPCTPHRILPDLFFCLPMPVPPFQHRFSVVPNTPVSPRNSPERPADSGETEANPHVLQRTNTPDAPEVQTLDRIQKSQPAEYQP